MVNGGDGTGSLSFEYEGPLRFETDRKMFAYLHIPRQLLFHYDSPGRFQLHIN